MSLVLVIGASEKVGRYSNQAIRLLLSKGHKVFALAKREGVVEGVMIDVGQPDYSDIDTVTLYIGPKHQPEYYQYILNLKPRRVIFNPGTENPEFVDLLNESGVENEEACTLVLLNLGAF
jgi:predicted CoA-binding protein